MHRTKARLGDLLICLAVHICFFCFCFLFIIVFFFFQAEDGIRDLVRSRGLGDVYKRQIKAAPQFISEQIASNKRATDTKTIAQKSNIRIIKKA